MLFAFINFFLSIAFIVIILITDILLIIFISDNIIFFWSFGLYYLYSLALVFNRSKFAPFFEIAKLAVVGYLSYLYAVQSQNMNVFYIAVCVCGLFSMWVLSYYSVFQIPLDD